MSSSTYVGNSDGLVTGLCPAPPPPPPPPPVPGQVPAMRINTVEAPAIKRPQIVGNDAYEPPAAIQNAMLTKDKKPFTYTPGMGGKLDLSQIRSPRMARRVAKNANDEGIEGPPKSALEPKPTPVPNTGANLFVQPQVAVPVFPTNIPPQTPVNRTPPTPPINRVPSIEKQVEPLKNVTKAETKVTPVVVTSVQPSTPESPSTPTQVTLTKAPTPWLQNKNKPQEELPEWAKRTGVNKQSSSSPDSPTSPPVFATVQQTQPPQWQQTPQKQQPVQPRPQSQQYQYQQQQQQPQQYQYQQQQPQQYNQQQKRPYSSPAVTQQTPQVNQQERVVPIRIEDRPSVFDVKPEAGHHQYKQPSTHHQQRWGQPGQNQGQPQPQPVTPPQPQQTSAGSYIIPIMVEGEKKPIVPGSNVVYSQPPVRNNVNDSQTVKIIPQRAAVPVQQSEPGPIQSRSFRVIQKITDTDTPNDVDPEQIRKLQLTEDDRILMNKFKEQVDSDTYLHHEEDPRYRGAAIPSRAFRFLQTMTDAGEAPVNSATAPRGPNAINKKQNRNSKSFEETQANLPPSEQQVPEPKKYMGSAIPSRSFRILQAMTAPESIATQENRQADYTCQTENNVPGNQQGVYYPPCPPPYFNPEGGGWWGYYPLPYPGMTNDPNNPFDPYSFHPDGTAYVYYPIYNQNYPGYAQYDPAIGEKNTSTNLYPQYDASSYPQNNQNNFNHVYEQPNNITAISNTDIPDVRLQARENEISNERNNLNPLPQWDRTGNMSRTASSNSNKDSDCTTAMNITDEEVIPEMITTPETIENNVEINDLNDKKSCPSTSLNVNVPNYTYIDTSDSSDSTDSESQSDNESIIGSSKNISSDTSDDDSDSYLAYSTGLNPHTRLEKDTEIPRTCCNKESCDDRAPSESSSDKINSTDLDSDSDEQSEQDAEKAKEAFPHQLSVIYEDVEHADPDSPRPQNGKGVRKWNGTPFEATDDPPDETDTTTVSVSLPLRFKFSVSENNEDVTTVIVGDSTIKPERSCSKDDGRGSRYQDRDKIVEKTNDVSANFQVTDTSVDFTVKRDTSENKRRVKNHIDRIREETMESKCEKVDDNVIPQVNFTLRKNPSRLNRINCQETVETEFTIKSRKFSRKEDTKVEKDQEERSVSTNASYNSDSSGVTVTKDISSQENSPIVSSTDETHDFNKNILKPEVIVSECIWSAESNKTRHENFPNNTVDSITKSETLPENDCNFSNIETNRSNEEDRNTDLEDNKKEPKHLLSVQNSREETDDEDSGVTSDMSRMISEVDTDSECTSSRNIRKYQRTQTHSRLFRLLNDDSILQEDTEKGDDSPSRREYLSLPLKSTAFNYDENYCSNYSSGLTSPEYSPVCEQSWRRLHDTENNVVLNSRVVDQNGDISQGHPLSRQERGSCKDDPYYQAWKTPKPSTDNDVVPSLAFKVLESRRPLWAYKVNVLCPRIKSTKNVPRTLQSKTNDSTVPPPSPSPFVTLNTEHC